MPKGRRRRRRGRCRGRRWINYPYNETNQVKPNKIHEPTQIITIEIHELEALRLVDLEDLTQEEAAAMMGVSRKTLWNDLHRARKKVTKALVYGYQIRILHGENLKRYKGGEKKDARWR